MRTREETIEHLNQVADAAEFIGIKLKRARMHVTQTKEKFGQVRVYVMFGYMSFHELVYPGYLWNKFPRWLLWLDYRLLGPLLNQLSCIIVPMQKRVYRQAYKKALEKFPHLRVEILGGADWPEYLRGL